MCERLQDAPRIHWFTIHTCSISMCPCSSCAHGVTRRTVHSSSKIAFRFILFLQEVILRHGRCHKVNYIRKQPGHLKETSSLVRRKVSFFLGCAHINIQQGHRPPPPPPLTILTDCSLVSTPVPFTIQLGFIPYTAHRVDGVAVVSFTAYGDVYLIILVFIFFPRPFLCFRLQHHPYTPTTFLWAKK